MEGIKQKRQAQGEIKGQREREGERERHRDSGSHTYKKRHCETYRNKKDRVRQTKRNRKY